MQDPSNPATKYLFETLVSSVRGASHWTGMFAFGTNGGIRRLLEDDAFVEFFERGGEATLILGIDAVTNRPALEALKEIADRWDNLTARVFWTPLNSLFHPKLSLFRTAEGNSTVVVGSGNLTPGGLSGNFEAYSVIASEDGEPLVIEALDDFLARHSENLGEIDEEALERASRNVVRGRTGTGGGRRTPSVEEEAPEVESPRVIELAANQRVLVALVPKAGDRWEQAHFNEAVILEFFQVADLVDQRVFLTLVANDGERGDELPRQVVYSASNKNYKIEIENSSGKDYPAVGRPILVMVELGARAMEYVLLFPGEDGHAEMLAINDELPNLGRGLARVVTNVERLHEAWPNAPFFKVP